MAQKFTLLVHNQWRKIFIFKEGLRMTKKNKHMADQKIKRRDKND